MNHETLQIIQEMAIPVPVERVWDFLMVEDNMKQWLHANEFIIDPYEGGKIEIPISFDGENCLVEGEVGLIIPNKKFVFTWIEHDAYGNAWFNNTSVTIELEPTNTGTSLTLKHDGFKYLSDDVKTAAFNKYVTFWEASNIMTRLQTAIMKETTTP
ncbi:SRPBCC family protein [Candidatus Leptofilum sp.]|uniref:SRPBCC family protein n=1 Tax=Candidatus Leptofilum sp. TaxID=3241576 RepID=UPI003B59B71E